MSNFRSNWKGKSSKEEVAQPRRSRRSDGREKVMIRASSFASDQDVLTFDPTGGVVEGARSTARRSRRRSPRNHVDNFPVKSEYSKSPQIVQNRSPTDHENSFAVKSECRRSPQNVQDRSPSARSSMVSEDSPSRKIGSSKSPQNDPIDPHTDGYHSSKDCERSFSPQSGSSRSPDVQKGFESDV
ncbi:hypothetical protein MA16_Dca027918 [Dendrobium catenatum]|uniref:Uncharacterized protein n=1 Tax=Dendrobium catenatum TaxID=906689 RepID=A0A2I0VBB3_9ASPA|nr:hypothetical protein MA16_Dca027918 [Dendrobium catenatum]